MKKIPEIHDKFNVDIYSTQMTVPFIDCGHWKPRQVDDYASIVITLSLF